MAYGLNGKLIAHAQTVVTLDSSGNGTAAVVFTPSFPNPPSVLVIPTLGDSGSYSASGITVDGFTVVITGSNVRSTDLNVVYFAAEKT